VRKSVQGSIGSTIGFYIGMPIKFVGQSFGGLNVEQTYYVKSLVNIGT